MYTNIRTGLLPVKNLFLSTDTIVFGCVGFTAFCQAAWQAEGRSQVNLLKTFYQRSGNVAIKDVRKS